MSNNLGDYYWIVNESKRVGGPMVFCAQRRAEGAVVGAAAVAVAVIGIYLLHKKYLKKTEKRDRELNQNILANAQEYQVVCDAEDKNGTVFHSGEHIKVIYKEKDVALIYRMNDQNSPYLISTSFLTSITNLSTDI